MALPRANRLLNVIDLDRPQWRGVIEEMHRLMRVPASKRNYYAHCTDRRSLLHRAEIESYKHWEYPWLLEQGGFAPGLEVLDCGCGRGFIQFYLALKGCRVTSVDISPMKAKGIRKFWHLARRLSLPLREDPHSAILALARRYGTEVRFQRSSIADLPYGDNAFDRVYSISVLEHMEHGEDERAMREMARVVKPGGRMLVTMDFTPDPIARVSYGRRDIERLIAVSGLTLQGNLRYDYGDWETYLGTLRRVFQSHDHTVSTAGFVLSK